MPVTCRNPQCASTQCGDSRYCDACGTPLMQCTACGTNNEAEAVTCEKCAATLVPPIPPDQPVTVP